MKSRVGESIRRVIGLGAYQIFGFRERRKATRGPSSRKALLWMTSKGGGATGWGLTGEPDGFADTRKKWAGLRAAPTTTRHRQRRSRNDGRRRPLQTKTGSRGTGCKPRGGIGLPEL